MNELSCRFCGNELNHTFLDLGMSPLSNSYISIENAQTMEPFFPLHAYVCDRCFLVQLPVFESSENIFSDYAYFSSYSDSWLDHCRRYSEKMIKQFGYDQNSLVVEIASNDGYLLQYFKKENIPILGIEPARNVAEVAIKAGIPTRAIFLGEQTARDIANQGVRADLLIGNNVLAHVPFLNDFVKGMKILLKPEGIITMEFPHLMRLMEKNQFDTIYHEHFSYFSFGTVNRVFSEHGLRIFDVEELPTHGGSLRIYACRAENSIRQTGSRVIELMQREADEGFEDLSCYMDFAPKVHATKRSILSFLTEQKNKGKRLVGYGAPAKGNTLLNYCGIRTDFIDYTVDRNPNKQDHYLPGTHIPVYHPDKIKESRPEYIIILPWNIKNEIMDQMSFVREWGGRFVTFIPGVKIY